MAHAAAQMDFVTVRIDILLGQVFAPRKHTHLNPIVRVPALVAAEALYRQRNKKPGLHCPGWTGGRCTLFGEQGESAVDDFDSIALAKWRFDPWVNYSEMAGTGT